MIYISLYNVAEIDTAALRGNIFEIRNRIRDGVRICAVVKANAYGHGAPELASRIEDIVDYFAVALVEEGVELRIAGISKPILVMLPADEEGIERVIRYSLDLSVGSFNDIKAASRIADRINEEARVHIKINTGMNRLGFSLEETERACREISASKNLKIVGCFSHFYNAENASETRAQFEKFLFAKEIVNKYSDDVIFHISASGGILAGREYDLDMVRPGILIYGYKPFESDIPVRPILKIKAKVLRQTRVGRGEQLLYGDYKLQAVENISIVRAGYADGLRRNGKFSINNKCMDVCAMESGEEWITVFDDAEAVALAENTIPYEILCGITARSRIIYRD